MITSALLSELTDQTRTISSIAMANAKVTGPGQKIGTPAMGMIICIQSMIGSA